MSKKLFISTPIYYPSGNLHIGHAYTTLIADFVSRYKTKKGYDVFFVTGMDEHGEKIQLKAKENNQSEIDFLNIKKDHFIDLWKKLDIKYDYFIRTTDKNHEKAIKEIFQEMLENDDIYLGEYEGYYCINCESYFTKSQLEDGKCPISKDEVVLKKEESYFFKMSKYKKFINDLFKDRNDKDFFLKPKEIVNEIYENFIKNEVNDLAVSRTSFDWGIKINEKHVIYVWLDALFNYLTALGYKSDDESNYKKYWNKDSKIIHIIGKEISRFHYIYWPIFLKSQNIKLPNKIYAHGWILSNGEKMSKSKNNSIDPINIIENFGSDSLRYYLLKEIVFGKDGNFINRKFLEGINSDLNNNLSNLIYRSQKMFEQYFNSKSSLDKIKNTKLENKVSRNIKTIIKNIDKYVNEMKINKCYDELFKIINELNKYIDLSKPWEVNKENNKERLENIILFLNNKIAALAFYIEPFLPEMSKKIKDKYIYIEKEVKFEAISLEKILIKETINIDPILKRLDIEESLKKL